MQWDNTEDGGKSIFLSLSKYLLHAVFLSRLVHSLVCISKKTSFSHFELFKLVFFNHNTCQSFCALRFERQKQGRVDTFRIICRSIHVIAVNQFGNVIFFFE
jgi:hypothetical protein